MGIPGAQEQLRAAHLPGARGEGRHLLRRRAQRHDQALPEAGGGDRGPAVVRRRALGDLLRAGVWVWGWVGSGWIGLGRVKVTICAPPQPHHDSLSYVGVLSETLFGQVCGFGLGQVGSDRSNHLRAPRPHHAPAINVCTHNTKCGFGWVGSGRIEVNICVPPNHIMPPRCMYCKHKHEMHRAVLQ